MSKPAFVCNRHGLRRSSGSIERTKAGYAQTGPPNLRFNRAPTLEDLLHCLRSNSFIRLPIYRKKAMLEGLLEMIRQGQGAIIREASLRIFGDDPVRVQELEEGDLPAQLIESLLRVAVSELNDAVRCLLWNVLIKIDASPEKYIRPNDFVREFWSEEPIGRANTTNFLLDRFKVDDVLEAVDQYVPPSGRKMPVGSCWCLIRYAKTERMVVKRARILRRILERAEIPAEKASVFFSEVLKALDRFSLIEVFSGRSINQVPASWPDIASIQLDFVFNNHGTESARSSNLQRRLDAIEMAKMQT
jgi:hypothetical protein